MNRISRLFIKTALLYLLLSVILFSLNGMQPEWMAHFVFLQFVPSYIHSFSLGWITQLIFGVSIWLFPRHPNAEKQKRNFIFFVSYICLNLGLLLRISTEPYEQFRSDSVLIVLCISAVLQWFGVLCYILGIWPRIRTTRRI